MSLQQEVNPAVKTANFLQTSEGSRDAAVDNQRVRRPIGSLWTPIIIPTAITACSECERLVMERLLTAGKKVERLKFSILSEQLTAERCAPLTFRIIN